MKYFNLDPGSWQQMSRRDKKILQAFRIVEEYHLDLHMERSRENQRKTDFKIRLPRQVRR